MIYCYHSYIILVDMSTYKQLIDYCKKSTNIVNLSFSNILSNSNNNNSVINYFGFNEVAFITDDYNLTFYSILSLLFGSPKYAASFLFELSLVKNKILFLTNFIYYLFKDKGIILVNKTYNAKALNNLVTFLKQNSISTKALLIGKMNENTTYMKDLKAISKYKKLVHPSSHSYPIKGNPEIIIKTYFSKKEYLHYIYNDYKIVK